ncbi:Hypothetical protein CINCED_3A011870 [Cinara cedri]|uniref:Uncharacterized protein n=1 Tax=Cinara cedri TaxID=506608 RepID=A0A5E4LY29_9HEMI|nr:Hypothetical protein CINCED_3A011870 [Cinara cedri]
MTRARVSRPEFPVKDDRPAGTRRGRKGKDRFGERFQEDRSFGIGRGAGGGQRKSNVSRTAGIRARRGREKRSDAEKGSEALSAAGGVAKVEERRVTDARKSVRKRLRIS